MRPSDDFDNGSDLAEKTQNPDPSRRNRNDKDGCRVVGASIEFNAISSLLK